MTQSTTRRGIAAALFLLAFAPAPAVARQRPPETRRPEPAKPADPAARPQFVADSTRVNHAADGSVHYTARYGAAKDTSAFGVLYPDKDKITSLASLPLNGPPQYAQSVQQQIDRASREEEDGEEGEGGFHGLEITAGRERGR